MCDFQDDPGAPDEGAYTAEEKRIRRATYRWLLITLGLIGFSFIVHLVRR